MLLLLIQLRFPPFHRYLFDLIRQYFLAYNDHVTTHRQTTFRTKFQLQKHTNIFHLIQSVVNSFRLLELLCDGVTNYELYMTALVSPIHVTKYKLCITTLLLVFARLQRMFLPLQHYNLEVRYKRGPQALSCISLIPRVARISMKQPLEEVSRACGPHRDFACLSTSTGAGRERILSRSSLQITQASHHGRLARKYPRMRSCSSFLLSVLLRTDCLMELDFPWLLSVGSQCPDKRNYVPGLFKPYWPWWLLSSSAEMHVLDWDELTNESR